MYSFTNLEPVGTDTVCCSMSSCNYCFLTCILISQKAGQVVWYSLLFQNFPQFIVIHTVKGFGIVNKAEIDDFLELACFFNDPSDVCNLISGSSAFSKNCCSCAILEYVICCEIAVLNMPANLDNSAVATGLEKVSFKERQCQSMLNVPHNCTHLTH